MSSIYKEGGTARAGDSASRSLIKMNERFGGGGLTTSSTAHQRSAVPSNFTPATADGTVFTLAAGEVGFIQNLDDAALAVKKGVSASTSSFSFILNAGSAADDGTGGFVQIDDWIGAVSVAAMTGSPRFIAWKQA